MESGSGPGDRQGKFSGSSSKLRFADCLSKYGTSNAQASLTEGDYAAAQQAAAGAGISTSDVLAIWDNETSFDSNNYWTPKKNGDVGPMQVTPSARDQLKKQGELPAHYNTDFDANPLAGAKYYAVILYDYKVPEADAAAVYTG